jgi:long-subunit acyl-CoA synthetase (AMP-forming)
MKNRKVNKMNETKTNVIVKLSNKDGNVFSIIGRVKEQLVKNGFKNEALEYIEKAFKCESYSEVLALTTQYVIVK